MDIRKEVNRVFGYGLQIYNADIKEAVIWHTVGGCLNHFPDIIVTDCVDVKARHLIWELHELWMDEGYSIGEMTLGETLNGTPIRVNVVELAEDSAKHLCSQAESVYSFGDDFYRDRQPCSYVQLIWSDAHGRLPHESGYCMINNPQNLVERAE
ncbi:MAG: DUF4262 domain-containing protein [Shewanella sp.]|uniref:DUF4262 domain-containing protein n=1 Tax=Shewanella sp. TaxID=50422 RepID=UPI003F35E4F6